jgi:hypothetical protein
MKSSIITGVALAVEVQIVEPSIAASAATIGNAARMPCRRAAGIAKLPNREWFVVAVI